MAHPRFLAGSETADHESAEPSDPIDDLQEWRPSSGGSWSARLSTLEARAPAGAVRTILVVATLLGLVGGGWWLMRPPPPPIETVMPLAEPGDVLAPAQAAPLAPQGTEGGTSSVAPGVAPSEEMVVQAAGAVGRPGVYRLPEGSRVDDLVREAAGLTPEADPDRVNLAAPLHDGERIWIPRVGEEDAPEVVAGSGGGPAPPGGDGSAAAAGPVNLNTATASDLEALPGIGPATASAILAHRDQIGSFGSVDELIDVRGIGDAKMEQLRPLVTV